jgi:hypothetical protein
VQLIPSANERNIAVGDGHMTDFIGKFMFGYYEEDDCYYGPYSEKVPVKADSIDDAIKLVIDEQRKFICKKCFEGGRETYSYLGIEVATEKDVPVYNSEWHKYIVNCVLEEESIIGRHTPQPARCVYAPTAIAAEQTVRSQLEEEAVHSNLNPAYGVSDALRVKVEKVSDEKGRVLISYSVMQ